MAARVAFLVLYMVLLSGFASAQPMTEPEIIFVIDEDNGECFSVRFGGDCFRCELPTNLRVILESEFGQCVDWPDMGVEIPVEVYCEAIQVEACCTAGLSDLGDCRNLVINKAGRKCAFVQDITKCGSFPEGWAPGYEGLCPGNDFQWLEETVECSESGPAPPRPGPSGNGQLVPPGSQQPAPGQDLGPVELAVIIMVVVGALSFIAYKKLKV